MSEPLILTLMKVPISIIKITICVVGSIFYTPSYLYFIIIKNLIFSPSLINTKTKYAILWLPKLAFLTIGFYLFTVQFYLPIKYYWDYEQQASFFIKIISVIISTGAFLFLMRKGYLKSLAYLKIPQLKSPKEHIIEWAKLIADIPSVFLGMLNIVLISHSHLTFKYHYNQAQRNFFPHITRLVSASLLFNFEKPTLQYLRIFPWRLREDENFDKQKQYTLQRSIILMFVLFNTNLDILVFVFLGSISFVSPWFSWRRYKKCLRQVKPCQYRIITLKYAVLPFIQYLQILVLLSSLLIQPRKVRQVIKQTYKIKTTLNLRDITKSINIDIRYLIISLFLFSHSLLFCITLIAKFIILISFYKNNKLKVKTQQQKQKYINNLQKKQYQKKPQTLQKNKESISSQQNFLVLQQFQNTLSLEKYKLLYAFQFIIDIPFLALCIINLIQVPFEYKKFKYIIDNNYDLRRGKVLEYFIRGLFFYPIIVLLILAFPLYFHRISQIVSWYKNPTEEEQKMKTAKRLETIAFRILRSTFTGLNNNILWYSLIIFGGCYPKNTQNLIKEYQSLTLQFQIIYHKMVVRLFNKDIANLYQKDEHRIKDDPTLRLKFWRSAHKIKSIRNYIKFTKIPIFITYYLKSQYEQSIKSIKNRQSQTDLSQISKLLHVSKEILFLTFKFNMRIVFQFFLASTTFLLACFHLWRLPTMVYIYKSGSYKYFLDPNQSKLHGVFKASVFVTYLQILDIIRLPIYGLSFVLCPLRVLKYIKNFSYKYSANNKQQFINQFAKKRTYFTKIIFFPSLVNGFYLSIIIFVHVTLIRISYLYKLLSKQKREISIFFKHYIGVEELPPLEGYQNQENYPVKKLKDLIVFAGIEAIRDLIFLPFYIFPFLFPYRIMHIFHILKNDQIPTGQNYRRPFVSGRRKLFLGLIYRILRDDFVCLILTVVLLFSGLRTKQGIILVHKNLKRNMFVGFLVYDYKKQVVNQCILLVKDVQMVLQMTLIMLYLVRAKPTFQKIKQIRKNNIQKRRADEQIQQIKQTTQRLNKEQRFALIGFENFKSIVKYLEPTDVVNLSRASKDIYTWCDRDQIWEQIWAQRYQKNNIKMRDTSIKMSVIKEFISRRPVVQQQSYYSIAHEQLLTSLKAPFSFRNFFNFKLRVPTIIRGQILNQLRNEQIQNQPSLATLFVLINLPGILILSKIGPYFINEEKRYLKQALLIVAVFLLFLASAVMWWFLASQIYQMNKYIGLYTLLICYHAAFLQNLFIIFTQFTRHSLALHPFDLPYIVFVYTKNQFIKQYRIISVYLKHQSQRLSSYTTQKIKILRNIVYKLSSRVYEAILPLYKKIANIFRSIRQFFKILWKTLKNTIISGFQFIFDTLGAVKNILKYIGRGYMGILISIMDFLLKYGRLGDLVFTFIALGYFCLPLVVSYFLYWKSITIIPSSFLTLISVMKGYSAIRSNHQKNKVA